MKRVLLSIAIPAATGSFVDGYPRNATGSFVEYHTKRGRVLWVCMPGEPVSNSVPKPAFILANPITA
jgi:hypothetical protein